jgi:NAD+ diphosphatase
MRIVPEVVSMRSHDRATWFVVHRQGLVARQDGDRLVFPTDAEIAAWGLSPLSAHRLGSLDDTDALVLTIDRDVPPPFAPFGLRALAGILDRPMFSVIGRAIHAADWITTPRFCGRCGAATVPSENERCTICPKCALQTYPRISPAIIALVRKGDLGLLASNAKFPAPFYSTVAGFSEIGESLEETLVREVKEEAGLTVGNVRYFGSQPWPFPNSLMIGFFADWQAGEIVIQPSEISEAKWFSIDELPPIPPPLTIARRLIDAWVADVRRQIRP